jgi:hypothetical protein
MLMCPALFSCLASFTQTMSPKDKPITKDLIVSLIKVASTFKDRQLYDQLSCNLLRLKCIDPLIDSLLAELSESNQS